MVGLLILSIASIKRRVALIFTILDMDVNSSRRIL